MWPDRGGNPLSNNLRSEKSVNGITDIVGNFPYRIALAGGWIDQPFLSRLNPTPPGSMVVIGVEPTFRWMDRCGIATSTRSVALKRWGRLPDGNPGDRVQELYEAENKDNPHPSGSQDMIGLLYPGVNRLDYDFSYKDGLFPSHIESNNDPDIACWVERVINVLPVAPRPDGYNPLGVQNLRPGWVRELGQSGRQCYDAIVNKDVVGLGQAMNLCMTCWEALLPHVVRHPTIKIDLIAILKHYQARYPGAMYSGCGGGYLFVASEELVPGAFRIKVREEKQKGKSRRGKAES